MKIMTEYLLSDMKSTSELNYADTNEYIDQRKKFNHAVDIGINTYFRYTLFASAFGNSKYDVVHDPINSKITLYNFENIITNCKSKELINCGDCSTIVYYNSLFKRAHAIEIVDSEKIKAYEKTISNYNLIQWSCNTGVFDFLTNELYLVLKTAIESPNIGITQYLSDNSYWMPTAPPNKYNYTFKFSYASKDHNENDFLNISNDFADTNGGTVLSFICNNITNNSLYIINYNIGNHALDLTTHEELFDEGVIHQTKILIAFLSLLLRGCEAKNKKIQQIYHYLLELRLYLKSKYDKEVFDQNILAKYFDSTTNY